MNKKMSLFALAVVMLATGCKEHKFEKSNSGRFEYEIFNEGSGNNVKYGDAILFRAYDYYNDSLMTTPVDSVIQVIEIDSSKLPADYVHVFMQAKKGDSIVTRTSYDSIRKFNPTYDTTKKGYIGYHFRILDIITDQSQVPYYKERANLSMRKIDSIETAKQMVIDDSVITAYLTKHQIKATKTAKGTYVEIIDPGTGPQVDTGEAIVVDYKGMTLDGKEFDSSFDSTGKSVKPFTFAIGQPGAIEGWSDGLVHFKKGGSGNLYLPSYLGYGRRGAGNVIPPNSPLIFYVKVKDILSKAQYEKKMAAEQEARMKQIEQMRKLQQMYQHQHDSATNK
ncbi:MAG: FKBP-type peptidyl-prolyl cis-trans isomerase [Bacteroidota bacterium]|nr:FKBP-type peptidyl-prolyl cis-trans isomerase [Bacteroidota bacterium]